MKNIFKIRPKFWGDGIWTFPSLIVIFQVGFTVFFYALSHDITVAMSLSIIFGFLVQPVFIILSLDQMFNCVVFTDVEVIFKGFLHKRKIPYREITNILSSPNDWAVIQYKKDSESRIRFKQIFFWAASSKKVIDELKRRTHREIDYPERIAHSNMYARVWFVAIMFLVIVVMDCLLWGVKMK
jgi:hypothetical protein